MGVKIKSTSPHQESIPNPRHSQKYIQHLASPEWAQIRREMLELSNYTCDECGISQADAGHLEVHHNTYESLGDECYDDLSVLCPDCHKEADRVRAEESVWDARVRGFAKKKWPFHEVDFDIAEKAFMDFLDWEENQ